MTTDQPSSVAANNRFNRINALVDRGWLRVLTSIEKDVWLCYERHANTDALSWPSPPPNPQPWADDAQVTALAKSGGLEPSMSPEMRWLLVELIGVGGLQLAQYALQGAVAKKGPGVPAAKYAIGIARGRMADQIRAG